MQARIELLQEKKLVGKRLSMSFANNRTVELWKSFMPRRNEIKTPVSSLLFAVQLYPATFSFMRFDPLIEFEKWAAVEVADLATIPEGMESFILVGGLYVVFLHKGSSNDTSTFEFIYKEWFPNSEYQLDDRPHFELLGEKYKNADPNSEEEIWIPIKAKL